MTDYKAVKVIRNGCEYNFPQTGAPSRYADVLVVGGGGGGRGGGGGGGGVIRQDNIAITCNENSVVVGAGGAACKKGGNSSIFGLVAYGGGSGCIPGGSSGGGGYAVGYCICPYSVDHCPLQGNYGGNCTCQSSCSDWATPTPGGGGAGSRGGDAARNSYNPPAGKGGDGVPFDISGTIVYYGAGGGGGISNSRSTYNYAGGSGGMGGGGNGIGCRCRCTIPGCNGSGWGAGGGGFSYSGHSGIVIVRYKTDGSYGISCATGGCVYTCGDYTIHCFTSNDTFCVIK